MAIVAINGKGESVPSQTCSIQTDEDELPPIIWATVPDDHAFFVGYTVGDRDYLYELEYGTSPGNYTQTLSLRNVGVLQVLIYKWADLLLPVSETDAMGFCQRVVA